MSCDYTCNCACTTEANAITTEHATISHQTFDGERALYGLRDAWVEDVIFAGPADGESVLKECRNIDVERCEFDLRYPFWHTEGFSVSTSALSESCRAALWYARDGRIDHTKLHGIKAVRECDNITLEDCDVRSTEFGWKCRGLRILNSHLEGEYPFLDSRNVEMRDSELTGKYSFQPLWVSLAQEKFFLAEMFFLSAKGGEVYDVAIRRQNFSFKEGEIYHGRL